MNQSIKSCFVPILSMKRVALRRRHMSLDNSPLDNFQDNTEVYPTQNSFQDNTEVYPTPPYFSIINMCRPSQESLLPFLLGIGCMALGAAVVSVPASPFIKTGSIGMGLTRAVCMPLHNYALDRDDTKCGNIIFTADILSVPAQVALGSFLFYPSRNPVSDMLVASYGAGTMSGIVACCLGCGHCCFPHRWSEFSNEFNRNVMID